MPNKVLFILFTTTVFFLAFIQEQPEYLIITKKDVQLNLPKNFPKPYYNFKNNKLTPEIFVLGRALFYDEILSKDNTVSCGSCHQHIAAFAHIDHKLSHGIYGRVGNRNIPALQNLIWNKEFMWDGGINHLEVQPITPITNPIEMDESLLGVISKLKKSDRYKTLFYEAFKDSSINSQRMLKAITQFVGLMITNQSKYDHYLKGKETFTEDEKKGLKLFEQKCASCHKGALLTDNTYRNNGLKIDSSLNDIGRGLITGKKEDYYTYKVPSLRNIERTYPYMHDGRFGKLKSVLNHYGSPDNFTENSDPLLKKIGVLTFEEKQQIISFLYTLTDYEFLRDKRFIDPNFKRY